MALLAAPSPRLLCQTALGRAKFFVASMKGLGDLLWPIAISCSERPDATDLSRFNSASAPPGTAAASLCLIRSQLVRLWANRSFFIRTSTQLPRSRSPSKVNFRSEEHTSELQSLRH